ncbi:MAG: hypothetical protein R3263_11410, partial [Myxococcota bacterium]|nr:hypothetical protein [Myxococcota bacterium]
MAAEWAQARTPLLLLLAGWSAGPVTDHELGVWMQGLSRLLPLTTLHLRPLDAADTAAFVDDFAEDVDASFVQRLHTATAGHPFFLVETLKALLEQRVLALRPTEAGAPDVVLTERAQEWVADQEITLTERMHRLIRTRLARVGNNSRDLLTAAAVLGEDAHFEHLCAVADLREGEALRCLDDLLQRDLLREQTNGVGAERYTLPHGVIAGVVYGDAAVARRRIFHRRALTALSAAGHPSATLARHARAARLPEATLRHLLAAGEEALALHASEQAVDHFQHARTLLGIEHRLGRQARPDAGALWARDLRPEPAALERLYIGLGRARELAGDYEGALAAYGELQELAQARDDRHLELAALMARTTVYAAPTRYYDPQHVTVLTEQALPLARALEDRAAEAKIEWNLLLLRLFTGEAARAVEHGERSLTLARQEGLREQTAYALHDLVRAYLFTGRPEDAGAAGEEAQSLWRALDNRAMLADNLTSTTSILIFAEARLAEARARIDEALALSREIDNLWNQSYAYHILGTLHFLQGRLGQSTTANRRAVELGA